MFEVSGVYANRKGKYTVLALDPPKMLVRFEDGSEANLSIGIQERIWENIVAETEAAESRRASRQRRRNKQADVQFFVKSVSLVAQEEISAPTWRQKITMVTMPGPSLFPGSRIIYYDLESKRFFGVATVTGERSNKAPKGFFYPGRDAKDFIFYPIDMDIAIKNLENAVLNDSVELESQPDYRSKLAQPEIYVSVSEDDFELLVELLSEASEEEEDEDSDQDDEELEE